MTLKNKTDSMEFEPDTDSMEFESEFDTDSMEFEAEPPKDLSEINAKNIETQAFAVNRGGVLRIMRWVKSDLHKHQTVHIPQFMRKPDFRDMIANKKVVIRIDKGKKTERKKAIPLFDYWFESAARFTYESVVCDATLPVFMPSLKGQQKSINLWRGFGVVPKRGDWSRMKKHIHKIIANDDPESYFYIIRWLAWAFQNPTRMAEVALVLLSKARGTGKGALIREIVRIFGAHGLHIFSRDHLTGRFNAHMEQTGLLYADEVYWPGDKESEGMFKGMISEPERMSEDKYARAVPVPNMLKIVIASNEDWVVPAAADERRFAVFQVSEAKKQNEAYFDALEEEMDNGGREAMLYDLLAMDLKGWHPRRNVPKTTALAGQKMESAPPEIQWLAGFLDEGELPFQHLNHPDWVQAGVFYDSARKNHPGLKHWSNVKIARFLDSWGIVLQRSNGSWRIFPPLAELRAEWRKRMPDWPPFNRVADVWLAVDPSKEDEG